MNVNNELYRALRLPIFQNRMYESSQSAKDCPKGDVVLVQSNATGLIFNAAFEPDQMVYDQHYQNEQAVSSIFQQHLADVATLLGRHFAGLNILEIGCGKGHFLEQLHGMGFRIKGLDPTYEGTNPNIIKEYFSPTVGVRGDAIILRHVLEHIQDPVAFLQSIKAANGGNGLIYIEVPCFDWICARRNWFDIFYEHVNYFRLDDFRKMFGDVREAGHSFGGQYLSVVADLSTLRTPIGTSSGKCDFPTDFLATVTKFVERFSRKLSGLQSDTIQKPAIWGGASKGVIFSLFLQRAGVEIDQVIDINPAKQGKFLAATGIQVMSPENALRTLPLGTEVVVMNGNYLAEVAAMTAGKFKCVAIDEL